MSVASSKELEAKSVEEEEEGGEWRGGGGGGGGVERRQREKSRRLLAAIAALGALLLLIGTALALVLLLLPDNSSKPRFDSGGDMLDYLVERGVLQTRDGLYVGWAHAANNKEEMNAALGNSEVMVLEADVNIEGLGTASETGRPIMAHPPDVTSDNSLSDWLSAVLKSNKGIKLDFKSLEALGPSLDILLERVAQAPLDRPIWLNADIIRGPNVPAFVDPIDATGFLSLITKHFPNVTLSPGWLVAFVPALGLNETYTAAMVREMHGLVAALPQRVTFPVRAPLLRRAWTHFRWLLDQSDRFSLTLWQGKSDVIALEDMLFVRDGTDPTEVYYDIYDPLLSELRDADKNAERPKLFHTGVSLLRYFGTRDGLDVLWHQEPSSLGRGPGGMLVLNVLLGPGDAAGDRATAVPRAVFGSADSNADSAAAPITLSGYLDNIDTLAAGSQKTALFLRILSRDALRPTLQVLRDRARPLTRPVWLSAAVAPGGGGGGAAGVLGAAELLSAVAEIFPDVTLAPAWPEPDVAAAAASAVVGGGGERYGEASLAAMRDAFADVTQPVSYQLDAAGGELARGGYRLARSLLLDGTPTRSVTISVPSYEEAFEVLTKVRNHFPASAVFYNVSPDAHNKFAISVFSS
uniref:Protein FAM151A n=2 Tax=Petromyzon marinus TaxID=7757 RepID=A0AAJ7X6G5_PETMA|nr:protein FAM151A isoform X1 [Petromyzon marinus]